MIRMFSLENSIGQKVSLNDLDLFGYNPDGLGISFSNDYYGANGNFLTSNVGFQQGQFSLRVLFGAMSNANYQKFFEFTQFLSHQPLTLNYSIEGGGTYQRNCVINSLSKTEINEWNVIDEEFVADFITPWFQWVSASNNFYTDQEGDGKIYVNENLTDDSGFYVYAPYSLDGTQVENGQIGYVYEENNAESAGFFVLNNDSSYFGVSGASPLEITIDGGENGIENPAWDLYVGSTLVQNDRYLLTIPPYYKLVVSSEPQNQRCVLISPTGIESNIYQAQDMAKTNFVTAPVGRSTLVLSDVEMRASYRLRKEWMVI